jgi:hypothetical protein
MLVSLRLRRPFWHGNPSHGRCPGSPTRSAGVCASAVKDFATVRNRSAHTTEDGQPRSQTVMTYSEPSPADLESVLETAPQEFESPILRCLRLRVDHVVPHHSAVNGPG